MSAYTVVERTMRNGRLYEIRYSESEVVVMHGGKTIIQHTPTKSEMNNEAPIAMLEDASDILLNILSQS